MRSKYDKRKNKEFFRLCSSYYFNNFCNYINYYNYKQWNKSFVETRYRTFSFTN